MGARIQLARPSLTRAARLSIVLSAAAALGAEAQEGPVEVTFLDVGQGDAIVIRSPEGRVAMVDAGRSDPLRSLARLGVDSLDLLVATHPHADHIGGMVGVLTARPVDAFLDNGVAYSSDGYRRLSATLERLADLARREPVPRAIALGSVSIDVLPLPEGPDHRSVGLVLRHGRFSALLAGDAEEGQLDFWVDEGAVPDVTLLKAAHHGSEKGFTFDFVEAAAPEIVVISVGGGNPRGHPRPEALAAYGSVARRVVRTDLEGHVTVRGYPDGSHVVLAGSDLDGLEPLAGAGRPPGATRVEDPVAAHRDAVGDPPVRPGAPADSASSPHPLRISVVPDARGTDPGDLNGEYAVVENLGEEPVDLSGWRLCDLTTRCFRFPPSASVRPHRRVVVFTGYGMADGMSYFQNNDRSVWNEDGDEATLYDAGGAMVARRVY